MNIALRRYRGHLSAKPVGGKYFAANAMKEQPAIGDVVGCKQPAREEAHMSEAHPFIDGPIDAPDLDMLSAEDAAPRRPILASRQPKPRAGLYGLAQTRLLGLAEDGKIELAHSFDDFVRMAHEMAAQIDSVGGGLLGGYARQAAGLLGDVHETLRDKPVEELLEDGRELIRRSPGLAVGVAMVAGFVAARLVKSSSR